MTFTLDLDTILNKVADAALQQCEADEASIMLPTRDGRELFVAAVRGEHRHRLLGKRMPINQGVAGWVARTQEPLLLQGETREAPFAPLHPRAEIRSAISVPMLSGGKVVGVLNVNATRRRPFTLGQVKGLNILVGMAAAAVESAWLHAQARDAEEKYRSIFQYAVEGIFQTTPDGRYLTANPALARIYGYESPEALMAAVRDIGSQVYVDPDRRAEFMRRLEEDGTVSGFESRVYRKDGEVIWISETARAVRDAAGTLLAYEGMVEDITARKRAEEALQEKTNQLQTITEAMLAFLNNGNWREASARLLRSALDQTSSEYGFVGVVAEGPVLRILAHEGIVWDAHDNRSFYEAALRTYQETEYLELTGFDNLFGRVITTGQAVLTNDPATDPRSGGLPPGHPALRHFLGVPILRESKVVGMIGVANRPGGYTGTEQVQIEVLTHAAGVLYDSYRRRQREAALEAARTRAEEALRHQEERYRSLVENAPVCIHEIDTAGRLMSMNPAGLRMMGLTSVSQVVGMAYLDAVSPADRPRIGGLLARALAGEASEFEFLVPSQGAPRVFASCFIPLVGEGGVVQRIMGITQDISQRKRADETRRALYLASLEVQESMALDERLGRLLRVAQRVFDLDRVNILLADAEGRWLEAVASLGTTNPLAEIRVPIGPEGGGLTRAYLTLQPVVWDGQGPVPEGLRLSPPYDRIRALRSQVFAILPLVIEGRTIGVLGVDRKHTRRPLERATLELLQLFASQAAVAIENSRLYAAAQARAAELETLREIDKAITARLELSAVLEAVVAGALRLLGTQHAQIIVWDEATQTLRYGAALGTEAERVRSDRFEVGIGANGAVALTRQPMILHDYQGSQYARPDYSDVLATITVPVLFEDRLLGVLHSHTTTPCKRFTPDDLRRFEMLAGQTAIAIEQARLYEAIQRHAAELEVRVEERTRELAAANAQLQAASRHKSEFLANMSHELRTPLNSIMGFSQLLQEKIGGSLSEKHARFLRHIYHSGKHLLQLISDILDLSKVEAGKLELHPEPLPVAETLEDVLVIGRGLAHKKGQRVEAEVEDGLPALPADSVRFKQILFNLLSNAVKFTPEQGRITVTARKVSDGEGTGEPVNRRIGEGAAPIPPLSDSPILGERDFLELSVSDTGAGIRAEDLPKLFGEFVQLDTTRAQRHEGTGLGLALTKKLVELHGGQIWADSGGAGKGSTFTVRLPFSGPRPVTE
jgi:PAS domain S-box-containing protein